MPRSRSNDSAIDADAHRTALRWCAGSNLSRQTDTRHHPCVAGRQLRRARARHRLQAALSASRNKNQLMASSGYFPRAIQRSQLPLSMAGGPRHLVGVRDGDLDSRLVRAGRDELGRHAHAVRVAATSGHVDCADVRCRRRSHRCAHAAKRDAQLLRTARRHRDGPGLCRTPVAYLCTDFRFPARPGAAVGYGHARRTGGRDDAARHN